jgi:hypothetical protein
MQFISLFFTLYLALTVAAHPTMPSSRQIISPYDLEEIPYDLAADQPLHTTVLMAQAGATGGAHLNVI